MLRHLRASSVPAPWIKSVSEGQEMENARSVKNLLLHSHLQKKIPICSLLRVLWPCLCFYGDSKASGKRQAASGMHVLSWKCYCSAVALALSQVKTLKWNKWVSTLSQTLLLKWTFWNKQDFFIFFMSLGEFHNFFQWDCRLKYLGKPKLSLSYFQNLSYFLIFSKLCMIKNKYIILIFIFYF